MKFARYLRPGDVAVALVGVALVLWLAQAPSSGHATRAVVRAGGKVVLETPLNRPQRVSVPGPLGTTVIEIEDGRVRIAADPGPRQYCVRQGWLARPGDQALCLPNRVSVQVLGAARAYDSLTY